MKCIRCTQDSVRKICPSCLDNWSDMRSQIFNALQGVHGTFSPQNHPIFSKETKRLESIWRKDKDKFVVEISKITK